MTYRLTPERRAEMVRGWQADRRAWFEVRSTADSKIKDLDERIGAFREGERD